MRSFAAIAVAIVSAALPSCAASGQRVLTEVQEGQRHNSHEFHVRQQSPHLCDAGSRFWTGTVNVTDNKSMFFCTWPSEHAANEASAYIFVVFFDRVFRKPIQTKDGSVGTMDERVSDQDLLEI
jgi:hypothetical protein